MLLDKNGSCYKRSLETIVRVNACSPWEPLLILNSLNPVWVQLFKFGQKSIHLSWSLCSFVLRFLFKLGYHTERKLGGVIALYRISTLPCIIVEWEVGSQCLIFRKNLKLNLLVQKCDLKTTHTNKEQVHKNKCIRFYSQLDKMSKICVKKLLQLNWLNVHDRYLQFIVSDIFRFYNDQCPDYFDESFCHICDNRGSEFSSYQTELCKMTPHLELLTRKFL